MNIIFDLDGTLIDSSPSILKSIGNAFEECQIEMQRPLSDELIGPPLYDLLKLLSGSDDLAILDKLAESFKNQYDEVGYKETIVFDGIEKLLIQLAQFHQLFIVTNKRYKPTAKIIEHLQWKFFTEVYALDTCEGADTKADVIDYVIHKHGLNKSESIYVGDTEADRLASEKNDIKFIMVSWGYGFNPNSSYNYIDSPIQLLDCI